MKILPAVMMLAVLVGPAYAQAPNINLIPELASKTPEEKEQDAIKDRAYRDSLKKIPDAKGSSDPWGSVRSEASKTAPKAAKQSTKTGSAAPQ